MNGATRVTLFALAACVAAFVAVWVSLPANSRDKVVRPASFFAGGLATSTACNQATVLRDLEACADIEEGRGLPAGTSVRVHHVDRAALQNRVIAIFGGLAVVVVLIGVAFGAFRRRPSESSVGNAA